MRGMAEMSLRMRSARAFFVNVWKEALEAFRSLGVHYLCRQHVVDADLVRR